MMPLPPRPWAAPFVPSQRAVQARTCDAATLAELLCASRARTLALMECFASALLQEEKACSLGGMCADSY